ncbi:MAG: radical SAM protein, partial [Mycoplasma sp.]
MQTKHLYIHIPFCKNICTYCDFFRQKIDNGNELVSKYIELIKKQVQEESSLAQFSTIYIGGGTPNFLTNSDLANLLNFLKDYIDTSEEFEFTIECNPEFITEEQVIIFKNNYVNRISLGVQILNDKILKELNRGHTVSDVQNAINILKNNGFYNISCDFIYGLENMTENDIVNVLQFVVDNEIKHVSYYALEVKEGSVLKQKDYLVDEDV